jgi:serine phosphatase RsbU (regulator of sigma subunit)
VNQYACAQNLGHQRFTTAFIAEWRPDIGCLTYVNAGHNWPVLKRSSGEIERLETGGIPLGIKADARYESAETTIKPGDALLIFTDGLAEAENANDEEFGEDRVLECLANCRDHSAAEVIQNLLRSVDSFTGTVPQHDDITCLLLRSPAPSTTEKPMQFESPSSGELQLASQR